MPTLPKEVSHSSTTWHHQTLLCICLEFGRPCLLVVLYSRELLNALLLRSDIWPFLPSASPFQAFRGVVIVSDGLHKSCESSNKVQTTCLGASLTRNVPQHLRSFWLWCDSQLCGGYLNLGSYLSNTKSQSNFISRNISKPKLNNSNNSSSPIKWSNETSFNNTSYRWASK